MNSITDLGSSWHNGVNQAGNKSFCSYRMGVGVPGYTGFVPVQENISVPHKEASVMRAETCHANERGDGGSLKGPETTHKQDFSLTPAQFGEATAPNALWDTKCARPVGDPPFVRRPSADEGGRKFVATSSYRDYDAGLKSREYPTEMTNLGQLRPPSVAGRERCGTPNPFYTTESSDKGTQVLRALKPSTAPAQPASRPRRAAGSVNLRDAEMSTSYRTDFGLYGCDPSTKTARDPTQICQRATTAEHFAGTSKAAYHPPGYSGFIPATRRNPQASQHGALAKPRDRGNWELSTLFQYAHQMPGCAGYRPQTTINDVGPSRVVDATTTDRFMRAGACGFVPGELGLSMKTLAKTAPQRAAHGKSGAIKKHLFSHESITGALSDNGQHDAEMYYHKSRPYEGRSVAIIKQGHWAPAV